MSICYVASSVSEEEKQSLTDIVANGNRAVANGNPGGHRFGFQTSAGPCSKLPSDFCCELHSSFNRKYAPFAGNAFQRVLAVIGKL